jgi:putative salt-induced outer membrane protein YdiY
LLGLLFLPGHAAQPVRLILRNGDRLTGTIVDENATQVTLTNVVIGRVQVPVSQIEKREPIVATVAQPTSPPHTNAPTGLLLPRPSVEQSKRFEELANLFRTERITAAEFEKRRAEILGPTPPAGPKRWSGEILSGIDLGYGSKTRQNFSGRFKLNFTDKRLRNAFDSLFSYGESDDDQSERVLTANRFDATDKVDYDLDKRHYAYALSGAGYDEIRKIDYYFQGGGGLGRRVVIKTNFTFNVEVGGNYQLQNFQEGKDSNLFYYRLAEELKWSISSKVTFDEKLEYTPQWNDPAEFKVRGEINLRYWLLNNLSLNLTVIDLYDTRVATDVNENDLQIRSSVGVKF